MSQSKRQLPAFLTSLAEALAKVGRADQGLAAVEEVLKRVERTSQLWWMPETLRIKGEVLLAVPGAEPTIIADYFRQSLELARRQGALAWELRTVISLARSQRDRGRRLEARDLLTAVYGRFTEGFATADLKAAKRLLDDLT